eukprot:m.98148 g.98148  ORF g.98148 m.98148 type:complete len:439 (-) comp15262_c0_seq1:296-1612(-)
MEETGTACVLPSHTTNTTSDPGFDTAMSDHAVRKRDGHGFRPQVNNYHSRSPVANMSQKWRNWWVRGALTLAMIGGFSIIVHLGHVALTVMIFGLQLKCFHEIISIGHFKYKTAERDLPLFRTLSWYFLLSANFFFYGVGFARFFLSTRDDNLGGWLLKHHLFVGFCLYIVGFCAFVVTLQKGHYAFQFTQFGWTHLALLLVVTQSHLIVQNIFFGLVWFLVPASLVICNDIMAYVFGFFFGKTPLIKLSPKKTWEGFLGAFLSTVVFTIFFAQWIIRFQYFVCPVKRLAWFADDVVCDPDPVFVPTQWTLPSQIVPFVHPLSMEPTVTFAPFVLHAMFFSVFASLIAPFGGFFASGLKRAFQIKDFDDLIPGHGGVTDRFDCQLFMASFVFVYYSSFLRPFDVDALIEAVLAHGTDDQLKVFEALRDSLIQQGSISA